MSGSVGRLKAVVEIVGREVGRAEKEPVFQSSRRQRKDWRQDDSSSVHSGEEIFFLRRGVTRARKDARGEGRIDESSERRKESVETFHKQKSRNRIKLTS